VTTTLLIFGAGGHGRVVADAALLAGQWNRVLASDRDLARCVGELLPGVPALRPDEALAAATAVHVAIGNAANREKETATLAAGLLATLVHPRSSVSRNAHVGAGCFIAAQAVVGPGARLGTAVIVNHGAVVDHDVAIGDFSHIAPLVALGGGVQIGKRVLVGSGASILPGVRVGDDAVIGAGAVVADHLIEPGVYAGVPARRLK
jgi:sugar O-acyltransferase (sialic acid O-acetyltransferase NeuD family)